MRDKAVRLAKALANESVRRLPYIILVLVILTFVQFVRLNNQTAQGVLIARNNSVDSKSLLNRVAALSEDNKRLTKQNIDLAKENAAHLDCIAQLFAQYTHDNSPVYIIDLDNCFVKQGVQTTATGAQSAVQPSTTNPSRSSSSKSNDSFAPSQSDTSQSQKSNFIQRLLDLPKHILGLST